MARKTANALSTAHSRPFDGAAPPTDAPAKNYRSQKMSETCLTLDGRGLEETREYTKHKSMKDGDDSKAGHVASKQMLTPP